MKKRDFLRTAAASALAASAAAPAMAAGGRQALSGPVLLTVTGEIAAPNRGPIDPALDQMMHKQKLEFE